MKGALKAWRVSLTHQVLITKVAHIFWPMGQQELCSKAGSLSLAEHPVEFETVTFWSRVQHFEPWSQSMVHNLLVFVIKSLEHSIGIVQFPILIIIFFSWMISSCAILQFVWVIAFLKKKKAGTRTHVHSKSKEFENFQNKNSRCDLNFSFLYQEWPVGSGFELAEKKCVVKFFAQIFE